MRLSAMASILLVFQSANGMIWTQDMLDNLKKLRSLHLFEENDEVSPKIITIIPIKNCATDSLPSEVKANSDVKQTYLSRSYEEEKTWITNLISQKSDELEEKTDSKNLLNTRISLKKNDKKLSNLIFDLEQDTQRVERKIKTLEQDPESSAELESLKSVQTHNEETLEFFRDKKSSLDLLLQKLEALTVEYVPKSDPKKPTPLPIPKKTRPTVQEKRKAAQELKKKELDESRRRSMQKIMEIEAQREKLFVDRIRDQAEKFEKARETFGDVSFAQIFHPTKKTIRLVLKAKNKKIIPKFSVHNSPSAHKKD